jgi:hypothetical protein
MFRFSMAYWCEPRIDAAFGVSKSRNLALTTAPQNWKRLAAYGDCALADYGRRIFDPR